MLKKRAFLVLLALAIPGSYLAQAELPAIALQPSGRMKIAHSERRLDTAQGPYRIAIWAPADIRRPAPLVLYAPGWGNRADDCASQLADLASHGYITVAFDDLAVDGARQGESARAAAIRQAEFRIDSPAEYQSSFALAGRRIALAAGKARAILDAIIASPELSPDVDKSRIGFLGFSFGGATGIEQSLDDPRIKAVANLDGWLFGRSLKTPPKVPYLLIYSNEAIPPSDWLVSPSPAERAVAQASAFDAAFHRSLLASPHFHWLYAARSAHEDLCDKPLRWNWRRPFALLGSTAAESSTRKRAEMDVIRGFFDLYLLGRTGAFPPTGGRTPGDLVTIAGRRS